MKFTDIFSGRRVHAISQKAFEALEDELSWDRNFLSELSITAANLQQRNKAEYDRTTLNGRQCFRMIGMASNEEQLFDDIAAGTRYMPPIGQVMISVMALRLFEEHGASNTLPALVTKIKRHCA